MGVRGLARRANDALAGVGGERRGRAVRDRFPGGVPRQRAPGCGGLLQMLPRGWLKLGKILGAAQHPL